MIHGIEKLLPASELSDFQASLQRFSDRCVRLRFDRTLEDVPFAVESVPWFPRGHWLIDPERRPGGSLSFAVADFYIQDAASLLPLRLLDVQADDRICDLCAAPGGKATWIAESLGTDGVVVANEAIPSRIDVLEYNLARTGRANYATCQLDPDAMALRCSGLFEKILIDVPCSGQTLFGIGKHDASAFRPKHIEHCAQRARRILNAGARMLAPGGLLVFSTCTFAVEENELQVEWLLREFPETWEPVQVPALEVWRSPLGEGCYRLWPHRDRSRGGFAAALRKVGEMPHEANEELSAVRKPARPSNRRQGHGSPSVGSRMESLLSEIGEWPIGWRCEGDGATIMEPGIERFLSENDDRELFRTVRVGLLSGRHAEPTHALAMANSSWFVPHRQLELPDPDAMAFMSGQSLPLQVGPPVSPRPEPTVPWVRATWRGKPMGWLKQSVNRWNNHLPPWARMTMDASSFDR
ncbi:MAG: hypothetical protein ACK553_03940 [Planctomycetota bacterium]|jgi:16S rRNA C967 or C1407 C5-methylase (RsmB/RsmF family)